MWDWSGEHQNALEELKKTLTSDVVRSYFDSSKRSELLVDSSSIGLGTVLTQVDQGGQIYTIAYSSNALSPPEQQDSQTEREALAVQWGCSYLHLCI